MSKIHPTAIIKSNVKLGENVIIEPYVVIKGNVIIGDNVTIKAHSYIDGNTTIGEGTVLYPSVNIGTQTQARKYRGETTYVTIGKFCEIRECVTINSSCGKESTVSIGDYCLLMAYCHISHNCKVGDHVIIANGVMLGGYVKIEHHANIGGMTPIHQFVRIGCYAMVGGFSRVVNDIPPYTIGAGVPYRLGGLNLVGLKRHKFSLKLRKDLTKVFKLTYRNGYHLKEALCHIQKEVKASDEVQHWINFCQASKRGLAGLQPAIRGTVDELLAFQQFLEES